MRNYVLAVIFLLVSLFPCVGLCEDKDVLILKFWTDPVHVYESAVSSNPVPRNFFPDPGKERIIVENYDRRGFVMFIYKDEEYWVNQAFVKLNKTAEASIKCSDSEIRIKNDNGDYTGKVENVHAKLGLGEGCK